MTIQLIEFSGLEGVTTGDIVMGKKILEFIIGIIKGGVIGIANIIPGVSGGTMALVLGIYERLIGAIRNISSGTVMAFLKLFSFKKAQFENFKKELNRIDAYFLSKLVLGALIAIAALAKLMTYLLTEWHDPTYGFFFGLVLVSVVVPYKLIKKRSIAVIVAALVGIASVVSISAVQSEKDIIKQQVSSSVQADLGQPGKEENVGDDGTSKNRGILSYGYIMLLGAVTISAMILPGVSGSLLLLILGGYFDTMHAISRWDFLFIIPFALGCLFGIIAFTRLLNFLLEKWHDPTMGYLLGLVVGSLWVLWPFKETRTVAGKTVYLSHLNIVPERFGSLEIWTLVAALAGMAIVAAMILVTRGREQESA
jgi:putative membrane protein